MLHRARSFVTFANVAATLALVLSTTGSAYAAKKLMITGANVKNASLTGAKIKNGSLSAAKLDARSRAAMRGPAGKDGLKGNPGPRGAEGEAGPKGDQGPAGEAAAVVTSYASRDTGILTSRNVITPNPGHDAWYDYNCADGSAAPCASDDGNARIEGVGNITLIADPQMVLALQGMSRLPEEYNHVVKTSNNVIVPWSTNLTGMATVTLLHEGPITNTPALHERAECGLQYANAATPNTFAALGEPQMVSAFGTKEIVTLTLVGSTNLRNGTYNVRVWCSDMDYASLPDSGWRFVRGNLTAFAARNDT